jgi:hypothetical protein
MLGKNGKGNKRVDRAGQATLDTPCPGKQGRNKDLETTTKEEGKNTLKR